MSTMFCAILPWWYPPGPCYWAEHDWSWRQSSQREHCTGTLPWSLALYKPGHRHIQYPFSVTFTSNIAARSTSKTTSMLSVVGEARNEQKWLNGSSLRQSPHPESVVIQKPFTGYAVFICNLVCLISILLCLLATCVNCIYIFLEHFKSTGLKSHPLL